MKLRLPGLLFILPIIIVLAIAVPLFAQETSGTKPLASLFDVTSLNGKSFKLEELKGKYVVLNFWFINCIPCVKEIPQLNKLVTAYRKRNFVFIAFTLDNKYQLDDFLKKRPFTYNIVPKGLPVALKYTRPGSDQVVFPTHIVINPKGEIQFRAEGASGLVPLQKELKRLAALK
jgi:peroxiredoxin